MSTPFVMDRYGNRIMAQTKCKGVHTRTLLNAFQAAVAVSLSLCGIPFRAASKGEKRTKGGRATRRRPLERSSRRKGRLMESSPKSLLM